MNEQAVNIAGIVTKVKKIIREGLEIAFKKAGAKGGDHKFKGMI